VTLGAPHTLEELEWAPPRPDLLSTIALPPREPTRVCTTLDPNLTTYRRPSSGWVHETSLVHPAIVIL
jgi:hypothetical protein